MPTPIRVLVIDDNELVCDAMARKLCAPLFDYLGSSTSLEGIDEVLDELRPQVVVLDLGLPGCDPLEWLRGLSRRPDRLRVAVLSGHIDPQSVRRAVAAGADAYLSKSEPSAVLVDLLVRVAGGERVLSPDVQAYVGSYGALSMALPGSARAG